MKSAITVSLVPEAKGGPFVYWDGIEDACARAAAAGFDAVEIFPRDPDAIRAEVVRPILEKHGLGVAAVGTGGGWVAHKWTLTHTDSSVRARAREFIASIVDAAAELGAPAIIGSMQGRVEGAGREETLGWLRDAVEELGERAARHGQVLLYEPLNRYETNLFNRQADAADFVRGLKTRGIRILADLFHMNIEEPSLPEAIRAAGDVIGHVHFADSNRRAIGFGHTDAAPVVRALRDAGYGGFLSAEILPLPDSDAAARQTIGLFRKLTA